MIHSCSSIIAECLDSSEVEKGMPGDILESREVVFYPKCFQSSGKGRMGLCRPFGKQGKEVGLVPSTHLGAAGRCFGSQDCSEEQNMNEMFILRCLSVNPEVRRCRSGLSRAARPEGDPGMSFPTLVQGYSHPQVRNIINLQILAQWKCLLASACLASHICSLKVYFPSSHFPRKFATILLVFFFSSFIFFSLHLFGWNSCPPAVSLFCFSSSQRWNSSELWKTEP